MADAVNVCPRCGDEVRYSGRGRPPVWCSQTCRQEAYETRRAAREGGRPVEVVVRERVVQVPAKAPVKASAPVDKHDHVLAVAMDPQAVLKTLQLVQAMDADESLHGIGWARVKYFIRSYARTMS